MGRAVTTSTLVARATFFAWAALLWACATGNGPDDLAASGDADEAAATSAGPGATTTQGAGPGSGGAGATSGAGGVGAAASGGSGGATSSSSSAASSSNAGSGGAGGVGTSSSTAASSGSGMGTGGSGGSATGCEVFETSVTCMAGWTVVFVATNGSQGGNFTYIDGACIGGITDVNCNPTSSVGTGCPIVNTTMTVVHTPCDNSPPCSVTFDVICP